MDEQKRQEYVKFSEDAVRKGGASYPEVSQANRNLLGHTFLATEAVDGLKQEWVRTPDRKWMPKYFHS